MGLEGRGGCGVDLLRPIDHDEALSIVTGKPCLGCFEVRNGMISHLEGTLAAVCRIASNKQEL